MKPFMRFIAIGTWAFKNEEVRKNKGSLIYTIHASLLGGRVSSKVLALPDRSPGTLRTFVERSVGEHLTWVNSKSETVKYLFG